MDYIDTPDLRDPWESLHVNQARKLLGGAEAEHGTGIGDAFEIYDVSDCRHPALKATLHIPDSHAHAGNWTPDGNFYYITQGFRGVGGTMPIVDTTDAAASELVETWKFTGMGARTIPISMPMAPGCTALSRGISPRPSAPARSGRRD